MWEPVEEERRLNQVQLIIEEWVSGVQSLMASEKDEMKAWDDVNGRTAPISARWVDTDKAWPHGIDVRCMVVARDFKGGDKRRDDLLAETPPLQAKRMLFSRAVAFQEG
eukprot:12413080-Karenia_brevis.AAC.2